MNQTYQFILQPGSKKLICPACNKKTWKPYLDTETGELLPEQYGRCDREIECTHHLNPYKDGYTREIYVNNAQNAPSKNIYFSQSKDNTKKKSPVFFPKEIFQATLKGYEQNVFIQNLLSRVAFPFDIDKIERVISQYYLGTICNGYRAGAITFPFIDVNGNVRTIQVKQFDESNHTIGTDFLHSIIEKHYTKKNTPLPDWLGTYNKNEIKVSCLFGEHLLTKYPLNPVALVEAPKTAVYGTLYFGFPNQPKNLLWLAVYNLSSLNIDKCQVLKGRQVYLFPDLSKDGKAFQLWSTRAKEFSESLPGTKFEASDLLETLAPNELKEKGADIADALIKLDWRNFRKDQNKSFSDGAFPAFSTSEHEHTDTHTFPSANFEKEFYHHTYQELVDELGYDGALQRVKQYQTLSDQYKDCKSFIIHNCNLLTTYYKEQQISKAA